MGMPLSGEVPWYIMQTRQKAWHLHDVSTGVAVLLFDLLRNLHGQVSGHRLTPLPEHHPRALACAVLKGNNTKCLAPNSKLHPDR